MATKPKKTRKPSLPPFFRQFLKDTNSRTISLNELYQLGYEPSGRYVPMLEDKGRSELMEMVTTDEGAHASFSLLYCAGVGYGIIHPASFVELLEVFSPEDEEEWFS